MYKETRQLTIDLTAMPSVNGSPGEAAVVEYLYHRLTRHTAYSAGRLKLFLVPAIDDPLFRPVLIAHLPGSSSPASATIATSRIAQRRGVLFFGHVDTVGTTDYGSLESLAFRPLELTEHVRLGALGLAAQARAKSGDWLFGRGVLDMKSGVAAALTAFEAMAEQGTEADLFFCATPDEESGSLGIKTLASWLRDYLPSENIVMQAAVNTDYTTWQSGDGGARHIYLGSIGKLLPAVYVRGVPSHAAEPENGLDPNVVVAAITSHVVYNPSLRDQDGDERCPYPVCLYQRDDKPVYDVQTAVSASAYFNLFHMTKSPAEQLHRFTIAVRQAVEHVQEVHKEIISNNIPVVTFGELWKEVGEEVRSEVRSFTDSLTLSQDLRERCRRIVEFLLEKSSRVGPCVVVYFSNGLIPTVNSGESVRPLLVRGLQEFSRVSGERFQLHRYFPYISDLSFLTPSPDWNDDEFVSNFPCAYSASPAPEQNIPTLMIGTYGCGAHQRDECVDAEYTFGKLPRLLCTLAKYLGGEGK